MIGAAPSQASKADFRGLEWRPKGRSLTLFLIDATGRRISLGDHDGAMIAQALAYAADGRPVAVTMTKGALLGSVLRIQVHPALVDTALGCRMIALDRFVDESTGAYSARAEWETRVRIQLALYQAAAAEETPSKTLLTPMLERGGPKAAQALLAAAFPPGWSQADPAVSVFAQESWRFQRPLVTALKTCGSTLSAGEDAYWRCVRAEREPGDGNNGFAIWSGVRERDYAVRQDTLGASPQKAPPLRFMTQVAFDREPEDGSAARPWEFAMLANGIERQVMANVARSPAKAEILRQASEFTLLQRLFRAGFAGDLGSRFRKADMAKLMKAARAADPVKRVPTPDWQVPRAFARRALAGQPGEVILEAGNGMRFSDGETCQGVRL
jgi:hypothetical protein